MNWLVGEEQLIARRRSDARLELLSAWFHQHYRALLRFASLVSGDARAAEDLVHDAFVRLYRSAGRIDDTTFPAYARRTIANLAKTRAYRRRLEHLVDEPRGGAMPDMTTAAAERDEMWAAILRLSPQQRAIVALRFYEDLPERAIAETLDVSIGTVKKQLSRALEKLRAELDRRTS